MNSLGPFSGENLPMKPMAAGLPGFVRGLLNGIATGLFNIMVFDAYWGRREINTF